METFDDLMEWAQAADLDGYGIHLDDRGIYWAEDWFGKSAGEFDLTINQGFLK